MHVIQDHVGDHAQEPAIFIGQKRAGEGRSCRIKNPDIVVPDKNDKTTRLIVEVDPKAEPVVATGGLMLAMLGDNITPSNTFTGYSIKDTLFAFVTVLSAEEKSQKARQFKLIEEELPRKFKLSDLGISEVRLCFGTTQEQAMDTFKDAVVEHLGIRAMTPAS